MSSDRIGGEDPGAQPIIADRATRNAPSGEEGYEPIPPDGFGSVPVLLKDGSIVTLSDLIEPDGKLWLQLPPGWIVWSVEQDEFLMFQDGTPKGGTRIAFMRR